MAHNQRDLELKGYGTALTSKAYTPTRRYADTPTRYTLPRARKARTNSNPAGMRETTSIPRITREKFF